MRSYRRIDLKAEKWLHTSKIALLRDKLPKCGRFVGATCVGVFTTLATAQAIIQTVQVGHPGYGGVSYTYDIGTYEVTAGQYADFLNAVARLDANGLYNPSMADTTSGSGIARIGTSGAFSYSVDPSFLNRPVNYVSYWDAARFANWLHNGQPTGFQTNSTTEDGAYTLSADGIRSNTITRNAGWRWAVTSEDEWYKAGHYKGGNFDAGFWLYPTQSNTAPGRDLADASGNNANYRTGVGPYPIQAPFFTTQVGQFRNTPGPYGTFDQAGGVFEWNDWRGYNQRLRGGSFKDYECVVRWGDGACQAYGMPSVELDEIGFRVCRAPDTCHAAPTVVFHPFAQTSCLGMSVSFSAGFSGAVASLRWFKDGVAVAGAESAVLTIGDVAVNDAGSYTCVATNLCGSVVTQSALLSVLPATLITQQPQSQIFVPGQTVEFSVASSASELSFVWRRNGVALVNGGRITGVNASTVRIAEVRSSDQGAYDCVLRNACGSLVSASAELSCKPVINRQPQGGTFVGGQPITLDVAAFGGTAYRWRRNGISLANNASFQGVTTPVLRINAVDPSLNGNYAVSVSNTCGPTVSHEVFVEIVCASDFNGDGGVDGFDVIVFFDAWENGSNISDLNFDGGVDFSDVETFFERWESGC